MMIDIYPGCIATKDVKPGVFLKAFIELTGLEVIPFSSARAAMVFGLRALGVGRMDEILVPPWLGHCVLSALARTSFPTMAPTSRTKAILVFHQFGYPQRLDEIEKVASDNGWIILNDCANTIFSEHRGRSVVEWGDFSVLSLSKLYPCALGGALVSSRREIQSAIEANYGILSDKHADRANIAHEILRKAKKNIWGPETGIEVDAVYGYIPELVAFPSNALQSLPNTAKEIRIDVEHRRHVLDIVSSCLPGHVPECRESDVVPFAIPVAGPPEELEFLSREIKDEMDVDVPILHFDFDRNMLNPDYKKSLVIGCHRGWSESTVIRLCEIIKACFG